MQLPFSEGVGSHHILANLEQYMWSLHLLSGLPIYCSHLVGLLYGKKLVPNIMSQFLASHLPLRKIVILIHCILKCHSLKKFVHLKLHQIQSYKFWSLHSISCLNIYWRIFLVHIKQGVGPLHSNFIYSLHFPFRQVIVSIYTLYMCHSAKKLSDINFFAYFELITFFTYLLRLLTY